jgi:hypothetical protein
MMVMPDEFLRLAQAFHQDSRIGVADEKEWIAARLNSLDSAQRRLVKTFLTELLTDCRDDAKLQQLWNETDSDFYIGRGARYFLTLIRDSIQ